jgi:hypothetical protein
MGYTENNPDTQQLSGFIAELLKRKSFNNSHLANSDTKNKANSYAADATYKKPINISNAKSTQFQLSLTWQYDEKLVELFLKAAGFSSKQIKHVWFGKYVQYWSGETIMRSQREWSRHSANHMQGYLLRPDYFEQVNGMLENEDKDQQHATKTKTVTVPRLNDGSQLQAWAIAKGLPTAPVGLSTTQYYQWLCNTVERKANQQEREAARGSV